MNNTVAGPGHAARPVRHKDLPAACYGIRHHGPGSARSVRAALAEQRPDVVLIEGPPEADGLVALAADEQMRPPVALLGYVPGEPQQAAFWPFAVFSPEWQAIRYALGAGIPVRFCDLPAAHQLAMEEGGGGRAAGAHRSRRRAGHRGRVRRPGALVGGRGGACPRPRGFRCPGRGHRDPPRRRRRTRCARRDPRGAHAEGAAPDGQGRLRADRGGLRRLARAGPARPAARGRR